MYPTRVNLVGPYVQSVRLADVFVLGPAMILLAMTAPKANPALRWFIGLSGVGTIGFNAYNWWQVAQQQSPMVR